MIVEDPADVGGVANTSRLLTGEMRKNWRVLTESEKKKSIHNISLVTDNGRGGEETDEQGYLSDQILTPFSDPPRQKPSIVFSRR